MDFWETYEHKQKMEDLKRDRDRVEKEARDAYCNNLAPQELANQLLQTLNIDETPGLEDLYNRLEKQAKTLDVTFYTSLYQAGLGFKAYLRKDPLYAGFIAQRQSRQTFDTLKNAQFCKQTEGNEKCED